MEFQACAAEKAAPVAWASSSSSCARFGRVRSGPARCAKGAEGGDACVCDGGLPLREVYARWASDVAVKSALCLGVAVAPALLAFRRPTARGLFAGFAAGLGFGWSLRGADLYLRDAKTHAALLPPSANPVELLKCMQDSLADQLQASRLTALKNRLLKGS